MQRIRDIDLHDNSLNSFNYIAEYTRPRALLFFSFLPRLRLLSSLFCSKLHSHNPCIFVYPTFFVSLSFQNSVIPRLDVFES